MAGMARRIGEDRIGGHGAEGVAGRRKGRQAWPGQVGTAKPGGRRSAGKATTGEEWNGGARQAWLRRHGLARPVLAGKAWPPVEALAWRCWLGEVGEAERGKARLARCGRARARHGRQGLAGRRQGGIAGKAMVAGSGPVWQSSQRWLGLSGRCGTGGVDGGDWQARRGEARSDRGTAGDGRHGVVRYGGGWQARQGWPEQAWCGWLGEFWREYGPVR
jgi:hypothetical protein